MSKVSHPVLHAELFGSPAKPQLVLLHGLLASTRMWTSVVESLKDEYHIIAIDLLGFGMSPKPQGKYDLDQHLGALDATLRQYGFRKPEMVVGYSLGAVLAVHACRKRIVKPTRLLLVDPPIYPTKGEMGRRIKRSPTPAVFRRGPVAVALQSLRLRTPQLARMVAKVTHPGIPQAVVDDASSVPYRVYIRTRRNILEKRSVIKRLPNIRAVGIIVGVADRYADIAHLAVLTKDIGELRVVEGHGHSLPFTAPEEIVRMIHDVSVLPLKNRLLPVSLDIGSNDI